MSKYESISYAIHLYGWENFDVEILEECQNKAELNEREKFWIAHLNCLFPNGYNLTKGGSGMCGWVSRTGKHLSAEHRAKIAASEKGKFVSAETRARISKAGRGRKASAETKQKLSLLRRNISDETRAKLSAVHKGHIVSEETRRKISEATKGKKKHRRKVS